MYIRIPDAIFFLVCHHTELLSVPWETQKSFGMIGDDGEKGVSQRGIVGHR